jgi:hypothetical protein
LSASSASLLSTASIEPRYKSWVLRTGPTVLLHSGFLSKFLTSVLVRGAVTNQGSHGNLSERTHWLLKRDWEVFNVFPALL